MTSRSVIYHVDKTIVSSASSPKPGCLAAATVELSPTSNLDVGAVKHSLTKQLLQPRKSLNRISTTLKPNGASARDGDGVGMARSLSTSASKGNGIGVWARIDILAVVRYACGGGVDADSSVSYGYVSSAEGIGSTTNGRNDIIIIISQSAGYSRGPFLLIDPPDPLRIGISSGSPKDRAMVVNACCTYG
ncbi:hypothetical protein Tco_0195969 [Tanacetum coccineum]